MAKPGFAVVWAKIVANAGTTFVTVSGRKFAYAVKGSVLRPSHTNRNIPRSDFQTAYNMMPLKGPGQINQVVQGPAYVYAILNDPRICSVGGGKRKQ